MSSQPTTRVHQLTGIEFIRIPAGPFWYGDPAPPDVSESLVTGGPYLYPEPFREVDLPEFWIARTPVTNAQYSRFLQANPAHPVPYFIPRHHQVDGEELPWDAFAWNPETRTMLNDVPNQPVVNINGEDALAYCRWAGLMLPDEPQWEKAARGADGRLFPWGDAWHEGACNSAEAKVGGPSDVGRFAPQGDSPYGVTDMAGNVWEWTRGEAMRGDERCLVVRGGSWMDRSDVMRLPSARFKYPPNMGHYTKYGFRPVLASAVPGQA